MDEGSESIRLMLVDDHKMLREGLRRSMIDEGFDVVGEAADGEEAIRLAADLRPDVILMDVSMPQIDGVEATRRIRDQDPDARIVMLTMHADHSCSRTPFARERSAISSRTAPSTRSRPRFGRRRPVRRRSLRIWPRRCSTRSTRSTRRRQRKRTA